MRTDYLGLRLENPLLVAASPLSRDLDNALRLQEAGAGAVVMYSLFEEEIRREAHLLGHLLDHQHLGHGEADSFLPSHHHAQLDAEVEQYLEQLARLKRGLDIPVIASLNGTRPGPWLEMARELERAGADAIELNAFHIAAVDEDAQAVEDDYVALLEALKERVDIPISLKLPPFFSSLGHLVKRLDGAGAAGVTLFSRLYHPEIDLDSLKSVPRLHPSGAQEALLAGRWMAMLYGRVGLSLAAVGGVRDAETVLKLLLSGADVVQCASLLLEGGPGKLTEMLEGMHQWLNESPFDELEQLRGSLSHIHDGDNAALYERADYVQMLERLNRLPGG